jgi:hypothetical protein
MHLSVTYRYISLFSHLQRLLVLVVYSLGFVGVLGSILLFHLKENKRLSGLFRTLQIFIERRVLPWNYGLTRLYFRWMHQPASPDQQPIVVFQMGKVGSKTVELTLKTALPSMPVYHAHILCPLSIQGEELYWYGKHPGFWDKSLLPETSHLFTSYYLRERIDAQGLSETNRWKIVTLVREPVARNISGFFEGITKRIPDFSQKYTMGFLSVQDLIEIFVREYEQHEVPLTWFDAELKPVFGVDVYTGEFPRSRGYEIYEGNYADVLLLRLENLNTCAQAAFKEFLNLDKITLVPENISRDKEYFPAYTRFLASVVLPPAYLDRMYNSKYAMHFYTPQEIDSFRKRWSRC